jgi:hypothetical protein
MAKADPLTGEQVEHRPILCALADEQDFQELSTDAQCLWFFLRICRESGPTGLFRFYGSLHRERLRMSEERFKAALEELRAPASAGGGPWVILEDGYILLRNAMRCEPGWKPLNNPNHLRAVHKRVSGLARLRIAHELLEASGLPNPPEWASDEKTGSTVGQDGRCETPQDPIENPSKWASNGIGITDPAPDPALEPEPAQEPQPPPPPTPAPSGEAGGGGGGFELDDLGFALLVGQYPSNLIGDQDTARQIWASLESADRHLALKVVGRWVQHHREIGTNPRWFPTLVNWLRKRRWRDVLPEMLRAERCECGSAKPMDALACDRCREEWESLAEEGREDRRRLEEEGLERQG